MMPRIRVEYATLEQVAAALGEQGQDILALREHLNCRVQELLMAGWVGASADTFGNRMYEEILPAMRRMGDAMLVAQETVRRISQTYLDAEQQAAQLFNAEHSTGFVIDEVKDSGSTWVDQAIKSLPSLAKQLQKLIKTGVEGLDIWGSYITPVLGTAIVLHSLSAGSKYAGEVIINAPDALKGLVNLRTIREWAGLPGHLNHIKYTSLPGSLLKTGVALSLPMIVLKWGVDLTEFKGTRLASAMIVDAGLTLAPVFAGAAAGAAAGAVFGSVVPGAGTAAGAVVGAGVVIGANLIGSIGTSLAIDHFDLRNKGIDFVDQGVVKPMADWVGSLLAPQSGIPSNPAAFQQCMEQPVYQISHSMP